MKENKSLFISIILTQLLFCWSNAIYAKVANSFIKYQNQVLQKQIQTDCKPHFFAADKNVKRKGAIVALHGFTACPQQYNEVAQNHWNKEGYDVYTLLLPGHGEVWTDEIGLAANIPGPKNWKENYGAIRNTAIDILKETTGEKVIAGLSVGGAVALWALMDNTILIDKALIISPYLGISTVQENKNLKDLFTQVFKSQLIWFGTTFNGEKIESWGEGCIIDESGNGRAGSCSFKRTAIAGIELLGDHVLRLTKKKMKSLKMSKSKLPVIQYIGVDKDPVANNSKNNKLLRNLYQSGFQLSACLYPAPANHSLISRYDTPHEDKFWLDSFLFNSSQFLNGRPFPAIRGTNLDYYIPECD